MLLAITPMAMTAKTLMTNFKDVASIDEWHRQNNLLREAVKSVKIAVTPPTPTALSESLQSVNLSSPGNYRIYIQLKICIERQIYYRLKCLRSRIFMFS